MEKPVKGNQFKSKKEIVLDLLTTLEDPFNLQEEEWIVQELKPKIQWLIVKHKNHLPQWLLKVLKRYNELVTLERFEIHFIIQNNQVGFKTILDEWVVWPMLRKD